MTSDQIPEGLRQGIQILEVGGGDGGSGFESTHNVNDVPESKNGRRMYQDQEDQKDICYLSDVHFDF